MGFWNLARCLLSTQANAADSIQRNRSAATVITLVRMANRVMDALNDIFGTTAKALDLRSKRMELISSNIANADVAGYKSKDIDFKKLMSKEMAGVLNNTHAKHLGGAVSGKTDYIYRVPVNPSENGNTVEMNYEQARLVAKQHATQQLCNFWNHEWAVFDAHCAVNKIRALILVNGTKLKGNEPCH